MQPCSGLKKVIIDASQVAHVNKGVIVDKLKLDAGEGVLDTKQYAGIDKVSLGAAQTVKIDENDVVFEEATVTEHESF